MGEALAYRGRLGCRSPECTRLPGMTSGCYGWHCPRCDQPCSSQGHDCPGSKPAVAIGVARMAVTAAADFEQAMLRVRAVLAVDADEAAAKVEKLMRDAERSMPASLAADEIILEHVLRFTPLVPMTMPSTPMAIGCAFCHAALDDHRRRFPRHRLTRRFWINTARRLWSYIRGPE
jgi:hypothetical protein